MLVVEAPLLAWSERVSVRWFSAASLAAIAVVSAAAALSTSAVSLWIALAVYGPAAGCALAAAEGVLVEAHPDTRERTLARLTFAAGIGDLAVPGLLFVLSCFGAGWRAAFAFAAVVALVVAITHACSRALDHRPVPEDDEEAEAPSIREAVRTAWRAPGLVAWSIAGAMTSMLDELFVAFAAIHLADQTHAGPELRSFAIALWMIGGLLGVALLDQLLERVAPARLLSAACVIASSGLVTLAATESATIAIAALFMVGASSAMLHPLARARAYEALPGRPAIVNALASSLSLLDLASAFGVAWIASRLGSAAGVLALLAAPVIVGLVAFARRPAPKAQPEDSE